MFRNPVSKLAVAVILVGAVLLAGPSFGFSSIAADRPMSVETAPEENALLGINATDETVTVSGNDDTPTEIGTVSNNLDQVATISVAVEHIPNGSDDILQAGPFADDVSPGDSTAATAECADSTTLGVEDVVFRAQAEGSSVEVTNATFTASIDIQCGQGGGNVDSSGLAGVSVSNLTDGETGQNQTIEFGLTNDLAAGESVGVTLQKVDHKHRLDYDGTVAKTDGPGEVNATVSGQNYELEFVANESIAAGETVTITVTGVDATGKNAASQAPYDATFSRSDNANEETTTFDVT